MKAEVMSDREIARLCVKYLAWDEPVSKRDIGQVKPLFQAQAEISFKAGINEVAEWIPQLIQKIKDAMWNDDWGVKGVIYEDMLDRIVGKGIHDQKKKWGIE